MANAQWDVKLPKLLIAYLRSGKIGCLVRLLAEAVKDPEPGIFKYPQRAESNVEAIHCSWSHATHRLVIMCHQLIASGAFGILGVIVASVMARSIGNV